MSTSHELRKVPQNQEHLEAEQQETYRKREKFLASLDLKDRLKFEAVDKAVKVLTDADVDFFLFPQLNYIDFPNKKAVWQWNSGPKNLAFDKDGKVEKTANMRNQLLYIQAFNVSLITFLNIFRDDFKSTDPFERLSELPQVMFKLRGYEYWLEQELEKINKENNDKQ